MKSSEMTISGGSMGEAGGPSFPQIMKGHHLPKMHQAPQCCVHMYVHDNCVTIGGKVVRSYDFSVSLPEEIKSAKNEGFCS